MIKKLQLKNFGPIELLKVDNFGKINVIIGNNSCGKTFLLKALYAMIRAQEEWKRGDDPRNFANVLSDKLYWTFQTAKLGELVRKGSGNRLKASITMGDNCSLAYEFGIDTSKKIKPLHNNLKYRDKNSIFLPPKEVLSIDKIVLKSSLQDKAFGFDSTYVDLVLALQNPKQRGKSYDTFKQSMKLLENIFHGKLEYVADKEQWVYKKGNMRFSINTTAEGIKKLAILNTLLDNQFLSPGSVIFIDEPESALHPTAISQLLDIVYILSEQGMQFFMATHSYYVVKKMYLLAIQKKINIPILVSDTKNHWYQQDLLNGLPENEIINETIRLYDQELKASLQ